MLEPTFAVAPLVVKPVNDLYDFIKDKISQKLDERAIRKVQATLAERIESVQKVKTIYKGDSAINLKEFYYPTKIRTNKKANPISYIGDITTEKNLVIQGTVGQGKSVFMRFMTSQEIRKENRIPVFFELRNLHKDENLEEAVIATLNKWLFEIDEKTFDILAESGKLVFFLDGFDEISSDQVKGIIRELEYWSEKYPALQIVVSSRPDSGIEASAYFDVVKLNSYDLDDQLGLIRRLIEDDDSFLQVKKAIETSSLDIQNLLQTPLMVTLFVMTYRAKQIIPESMSDFYEDIFQVLMHRHDKTKPGFTRELRSSLNEKNLQETFEYLCFLTKKEKNNTLKFDRQKLIALISTSLEKSQHKEQDPFKVLSDITKVLCLIIQEGNEYSFIHKSIQEFFIANFIKKLPEQSSIKIYQHIINNYDDFRVEISFLKEIDKYKFNKFFIKPQIDQFLSAYPDLENKNIDKLLNDFYFTQDNEKIKEVGVSLPSHGFINIRSWLISIFLESFTMASREKNDFIVNRFSITSERDFLHHDKKLAQTIISNNFFQEAIHFFSASLIEIRNQATTYILSKEDTKILDDL